MDKLQQVVHLSLVLTEASTSDLTDCICLVDSSEGSGMLRHKVPT